EFHGVVMDAAFAADAVDGNDVRMLQRGGGAGFVLEALQLARVHGSGERQYLESDATIEGDLLNFVNHAHAAAADFAQNAEVTEDPGAGSGRYIRGLEKIKRLVGLLILRPVPWGTPPRGEGSDGAGLKIGRASGRERG